jgi:tetratricopeptide (TPR) repeat protein
MAKISLRAYDREIEGLIEHDQRTDEAIAHCRHILKTYPKHLETYRLLGKAYLEAKRYQEAVDIFERVLMAAPEDFVSHVGMSIIADDQGKLDEAIWHMERAFEMQPSNAAIQGELQRLFARRDGVEPSKIRLTRGALARMYMQGELYTQAISEIKAVLGGDPKRADMQVLLAKACYLSGQKLEATTISTELLGRYPYCLDANRLMAEILPGTQRADAAQEYRQRAVDLDPYAAFAPDSLFHPENVADSAVSMERLEYAGPLTEQAPVLGLGPGIEARTFAHAAGEPDWLASGGAPQSASVVEPPSVASAGVPDFLREAGWTEKSSEPAPESAPMAEEAESIPAAVPADLPAWVQAFAPVEQNEPESEPVIPPVEAPDWLTGLGSVSSKRVESSSTPEIDASAPDWLNDLRGREVDEPSALTRPPEQAEASGTAPQPLEPEPDSTPTWLKDFETDLESPVQRAGPAAREEAPASVPIEPAALLGSLGTTEREQDDAMAWLESLAEKHGAKPEELVTDPKARKETAPDWVDKAREIGKQEPDAFRKDNAKPAPEPVPSDLDLTGKWLSSLRTGDFEDKESEAEPWQPAGGTPFDWISGLSEQGVSAAPGAPADREDQPIMEAGEVPAWLDDSGPKPAQKPALGDAPSWLAGDAAGSRPAPAEIPATSPGPAESAVDLPEWLAGLDEEKSEAVPAVSSEEGVPLWLRTENEPTPHVTEPTHPADWRPAEPAERPAQEAVPANLEAPAVASAPIPSSGSTPAPESSPRPSVPPRPRPAAVLPKAIGATQASLLGAESELGRGNIAAALDLYARLIRKGKSLEDIIRDLRDALYRYPVEVPIWQALGDAYMRANRLQEALDAYTKAEELLR